MAFYSNSFEAFSIDYFHHGLTGVASNAYMFQVANKPATFVRGNKMPEEAYTAAAKMSNDTVFLYLIPKETYPRRIYAYSDACEYCKHVCDKCKSVRILEPDGYSWVEWCDIHSDSKSECPARMFILDLLDRGGDKMRGELETLNALPGEIDDMYKVVKCFKNKAAKERYDEAKRLEDESRVAVAAPTVKSESPKKSFYIEDAEDAFIIHFMKGEKQLKRKLHCSKEDADIILDGLVSLNAGQVTQNEVANRIWYGKSSKVLAAEETEALKQDVAHLKAELKDAYAEIHSLKAQLNHSVINANSNNQDSELFAGERDYFIYDSLQKFLDSRKTSTLPATRRDQVLRAILDEVNYPDLKSIYKDILTPIMQESRHKDRTIRSLESIGFKCDIGGNHCKIYPAGHKELTVTVACTPSDRRAAANEVSMLLNRLFS